MTILYILLAFVLFYAGYCHRVNVEREKTKAIAKALLEQRQIDGIDRIMLWDLSPADKLPNQFYEDFRRTGKAAARRVNGVWK